MVHGPHDDFSSETTKSDPFSESYDRMKIYAAATDSKGHSTSLRTHIPPHVMSTLGELAASRAIDGIRRPSDAIRDALVHRCHDYYEMVNTSDPVLREQMLMCAQREKAFLSLDMYNERIRSDEKKVDEAIATLYRRGIEALDIVAGVRNSIITEEYRERLDRTIAQYMGR